MHFLHVPKAGGTAIRTALQGSETAGRRRLVLHGHHATARSIPEGHHFFFVVRDPVARFVSAFYSRQRRGRPRYDVPWAPEEAFAFERFATPNELGEALGGDLDVRQSAERAMRGVPHFRRLRHWLGSPDELRRDADRVFAVLSQQALDADFAVLVARLGLSVSLPLDDVAAHRNPPAADIRMTDTARECLQRWYAPDYELLAVCRELVSGPPASPVAPDR